MNQISAMIKFYGGCIEDVILFDDQEKLAAAFEKATGTSYSDYLNDGYKPDLEHEYVECHVADNELGRQNKEQVISQLVYIAQQNILELETRSDLESHHSDSEDFFTTSIWNIKSALIDAYNLGMKNALVSGKDKSSLDSIIQSADERLSGVKTLPNESAHKSDLAR